MSASLVGSEMCIRDRFTWGQLAECYTVAYLAQLLSAGGRATARLVASWSCLLYTSDAADDM
eukprot:13714422-Alexandrium_andersonii.AAC.1